LKGTLSTFARYGRGPKDPGARRHQKLLITAVKTWLMLVGSLAS
jgi:hypothetical protein